MGIHNRAKRSFILAVLCLVIFIGAGITGVRRWLDWREQYVVTRTEAQAFADTMGDIFATGTQKEVRALFFDDAVIRNKRRDDYEEFTKDSYLLAAPPRKYKHSVVAIEKTRTNRIVMVSLDCRVQPHALATILYRKRIMLQKRDGHIGIVQRERDLPKVEPEGKM